MLVSVVSFGGKYGDVQASALAENVQDGQILHCWNWSFENIKDNMAKIAEQGFSAIQTSPIQASKESTQGKPIGDNWWIFYQPVGFGIETNEYNALGTSKEFKEMCDEAEKYGIKVIVDAVLNHLGNHDAGNTLSLLIPDDIRNDADCWHDITKDSWYETRWDITQFCMGGLPDLNTSNQKIQDYAVSFLKECIDAGADGFRFDGAKHIEVPTDYDYASDFWPTVIGEATEYAQETKGFTPFFYGELLDGTSGSGDRGDAQKALNSYMEYMSVTQSSVSNAIRYAVETGNAQGATRSDFYFNDGSLALGSKSVLWNESHDNYMHDGSQNISTSIINKVWAIVGSRNEAAGLYFARPLSLNDPIGTAGITGWASSEVKAVNQFKNQYVGESEYISAIGSLVVNERGTTGAVIVNCTGNQSNIAAKAYKLENGTYTDAISGNTFTVSKGEISGMVGSTGIAVITLTEKADTPEVPEDDTTVYFDNSSYGWKTVYAYVYTDSGASNGAWPGVEMELDAETGYYKITLSDELANGRIIFTESNNATTNRYPGDGASGLKLDGKDMIFSANHTWEEYVKPAEDINVYFDNSSYGWKTVYAYVYTDSGASNGAWPGVEMELDAETGYYKITLSDELANGRIIFTESNNATTNRYPGDGASGLKLDGKDMIFSANHTWEEYVEPVKPIETINVYFDNSSYGWKQVYAYVYTDSGASNGAWPGVEMKLDADTGYYKITLSGEFANGRIIFTESNNASTNRYPGDFEEGLKLNGKDMIFSANHTWKEYSASLVLTNEKYEIKDNFLCNVSEETGVSEIISAFSTKGIAVFNAEGKKVSESEKIGTGYVVSLIVGGETVDSLTVIILGDVDGSGIVDSTDYLRTKQHFLGKLTLEGLYAMASDVDNSQTIDATDYLKIKSHFLGNNDLYA